MEPQEQPRMDVRIGIYYSPSRLFQGDAKTYAFSGTGHEVQNEMLRFAVEFITANGSASDIWDDWVIYADRNGEQIYDLFLEGNKHQALANLGIASNVPDPVPIAKSAVDRCVGAWETAYTPFQNLNDCARWLSEYQMSGQDILFTMPEDRENIPRLLNRIERALQEPDLTKAIRNLTRLGADLKQSSLPQCKSLGHEVDRCLIELKAYRRSGIEKSPSKYSMSR